MEGSAGSEVGEGGGGCRPFVAIVWTWTLEEGANKEVLSEF